MRALQHPPYLARTSCAAGLTLALLGLPTITHGQTHRLVQPSVHHTVLQGDTLEQLAHRYLGDATLWQQLQSHNSVPSPYRLRPGSVLEIPLKLMRTATASVEYLQGNANLTRSAGTGRTPLQQGMPLREGDQIQLDPDAFVSVRLADGSTVRVQAQSQLQLTQLRRRGRAGSLQSVLDLQQGALEIQVPGKADTTRRLDVITPVAATSVRGTQFNVRLDDSGRTSTALYTGKLAVQGTADTTQVSALTAGHGLAVSPQGTVSTPTPLLPAPDASSLPTLNENAQWLELPLPALAGAQAWQVQVSADAANQQVLRNGQFAPGTARFAALPDGDYFLRVRAQDAQGLDGMATQVPLRVKAHPVAPLTQSPAPGGLLAQGEAQLLCTPVAGAQAYRLQLTASAGDAASALPEPSQAPVLDINDSAQCKFDLSAVPAGNYVWRTASIRRLDNNVRDQGPLSAPQTLRIAPRPATPGADDVRSQTIAGIAQIFWPGEDGQRYRLQALATPDAETPTLDTVLTQPQWTATDLPPGTWHIRIQVQDPSGLNSAFSPPRSIQVLPLVVDGSGQAIGTHSGLGLEHPSYGSRH